MSNDLALMMGDLVKTADDYYAIILFFEGNEVGLFLCNGMVTVAQADDLEALTIHDGPSHANFSELIAAHLQTPTIQMEITTCPKALNPPS